jgi:hypothetical protein
MQQSEFEFNIKPPPDDRLPKQSREAIVALMAQIISTVVLQEKKGENNEQGSFKTSKNQR